MERDCPWGEEQVNCASLSNWDTLSPLTSRSLSSSPSWWPQRGPPLMLFPSSWTQRRGEQPFVLALSTSIRYIAPFTPSSMTTIRAWAPPGAHGRERECQERLTVTAPTLPPPWALLWQATVPGTSAWASEWHLLGEIVRTVLFYTHISSFPMSTSSVNSIQKELLSLLIMICWKLYHD